MSKQEPFKYDEQFDFDINEVERHWIDSGFVDMPRIIEVIKRYSQEIKSLRDDIANINHDIEKLRNDIFRIDHGF